jgi:acetyltransferase-like isoleucine patch superfamily enzyme
MLRAETQDRELAGASRQRPGWDARRPRTIAAAERMALLVVAPLLLAHRLGAVSFLAGGQALSLVPGAPGLLVRRAWYGATLARCGRRLTVQFGTVIAHSDTRIADDCYLGPGNSIGLATIGEHFVSGPRVCVLSGRRQHSFDRRDMPVRDQPGVLTRVSVGADVYAGTNATIAADVAAHCVVGAGAVVTKAFPEWSVLAGNPARVLRERA